MGNTVFSLHLPTLLPNDRWFDMGKVFFSLPYEEKCPYSFIDCSVHKIIQVLHKVFINLILAKNEEIPIDTVKQ